jgi:hypothetical protein
MQRCGNTEVSNLKPFTNHSNTAPSTIPTERDINYEADISTLEGMIEEDIL